MIDILNCKYVHSPIRHTVCNRNVFTNFLPCSHTIKPNNETCLVTCTVSLTCATWLMYVLYGLILNQDTSVHAHLILCVDMLYVILYVWVGTYICAMYIRYASKKS